MRSSFWEEQAQEGGEGRPTVPPRGWEKRRTPETLGTKAAQYGTGHSVKMARGKMGAIRKKPVFPWFVNSGWIWTFF